MIVHLDKPAAAKMIQVMDYVRRNAIVVRVSMEASLIVILIHVAKIQTLVVKNFV